jgi:hypothetical protein
LSLERVLVWPEAYPLLIKGLLEQNGAFILDALEAWPKCQTTTDNQGISSCVLPPLYYLLWQQPAEPFEQCFYQHIAEYDEPAQSYIQDVLHQLKLQLGNKEAISELFLTRIEKYAPITDQITIEFDLSLTSLLMDLRYFKIFHQMLALELKLSCRDVLIIWQDHDFRKVALDFIKSNFKGDLSELVDEISTRLKNGEDYFDLLIAMSDEEVDNRLLERALLFHISQPDAKQSLCMRFIQQGAKGEISDKEGLTALIWSVKQGFSNVFDALINRDRNNETDAHNNNLLHYAVRARNLDIMSKALKLGVNYRQSNHAGLTPYRLAVDLEYLDVVKHLEQKFGIKELKKEEQMGLVKTVHMLHAIVCLIFPLQLFFIFSDNLSIKTEIAIATTLISMALFAYATLLKRSSLYPTFKSPVTFSIIKVFSPIFLALSLLLLFIILTTVLS